MEEFGSFVFSPPAHDPRRTRTGSLLRVTSLDEVPQLLNVLRGEMTLVGPRPEVPQLVARYPARYHTRHHVPPGLTGLAQVNGRSDLTYGETMAWDLAYVRHRSDALDLRILGRTAGAVLRREGAR
jgi:lipopolysaccharide/colanic/teichoic acid biosynthesis glycosyltransferase